MTNQLTASELLSSLGSTSTLNPLDQEASIKADKGRSAKGFLTAQFPLFSTPYFTIYLQGFNSYTPALLSANDQEVLTNAFTHSVVRKLGKKAASQELILLIDSFILDKNYKDLYTNKAFHKEFIISLVQAGAVLQKDSVVNRNYPLKAVKQYLLAMESFLEVQGYDSPDAYLANRPNVKRNIGPSVSIEDMENLWDIL